ncbi:MAG TPA: toll/interleukin-1 receptor domain-containing protein [Thermoanaerobaculia bacterium]
MPEDARPKRLRVFLSYSHDSAEHAERVLALADRLRSDGLDAWIDQYEPEPEDGWPRWMVDQIEKADRVLAVCTETYRRRLDGKETEGGLGVDWEGAILTDAIYRRRRTFVVPVVFEEADAEHIPVPLRRSGRPGRGLRPLPLVSLRIQAMRIPGVLTAGLSPTSCT